MHIPKPQSLDRKSPWRYCKFRKANGERCGKVFKISGVSSSKCPACVRLATEAKRASRGDRRIRTAPYTKPPKDLWSKASRKRKTELAGNKCEVCARPEAEVLKQYGVRLTRDHLIPVRYCGQYNLGDPHIDLNIVLTCPDCGGKKTAAEVKLFQGNLLEFVADLARWGWNMPYLQMVMRHYEIYASSLENYFRGI